MNYSLESMGSYSYHGFIKSFASVNLLLKKKSTANLASANEASRSIPSPLQKNQTIINHISEARDSLRCHLLYPCEHLDENCEKLECS